MREISKVWLAIIAILAAAAFVAWALNARGQPAPVPNPVSGFSYADYPWVYNSETATQTLKQSDVIIARQAIGAACEFYNNTAANAWFMLYNSATVAAQTPQNMIAFCWAGPAQPCSAGAGGPSGPATNSAIPAANGMTWFASSTFPTQTGIGANGFVICTLSNK